MDNKEKNMPEKGLHSPHDKLFKQMMKKRELALSFFQTHLPQPLQRKIDWDSLSIEKTSFLSEDFKSYESDILYKGYLNNAADNKPIYLYALSEHQTNVDRFMPLRLLRYTVEVMQQHIDKGSKDLPIVYPIVYHCSATGYTETNDIFDLFGSEEAKTLAQTYLFKPFQLIEVSKLSSKEIATHGLSGMMDFFLKTAHAASSMIDGEKDVEELFRLTVKMGQQGLIMKGFEYILKAVEDGEKYNNVLELTRKVSNELGDNMASLAQQFEEKGRVEGRVEGHQEEKLDIAKNLLKMGTLDNDAIAKATGLSLREIKEIAETIKKH